MLTRHQTRESLTKLLFRVRLQNRIGYAERYRYALIQVQAAVKTIKIKRIYDVPEESDGFRVLVDRLWPRGLSKSAAESDLWLKEIAPSTELRKWFGHDVGKWDLFFKRYIVELENNRDIVDVLLLNSSETITLLYSAKDARHNQAVVLADYLNDLLRTQKQ